jgi:hypothetical protein
MSTRIVACINFCAGVSNEELAATTLLKLRDKLLPSVEDIQAIYAKAKEPRPILPPALLAALKEYIDHSTAAAMGAAFDYKAMWSAVEAANREEP